MSKQFFNSLRHYPNFRLFWVGTFFSSLYWQIDRVVLGWLVLAVSNSPLILGIVEASRYVFQMFAPMVGVFVDRIDKRKLLITIRATEALLMLLLAILVSTDLIKIWHIIVITSIRGLTFTFSGTTYEAFVADIVERSDLMNALALSMTAMNIVGTIGPALGGQLIDWIGYGACYYLMVPLILLDVAMLSTVRVESRTPMVHHGSGWRGLIDGLKYIRSSRSMVVLMLIAALANLFAFPYFAVLPIFARDVLRIGATGLGWLWTAAGLGSLIGALNIAFLGKSRKKGWFLIGTSSLWGVMLLLFSASIWFPLSMLFLIGVGLMQNMSMIIISTLLLTGAPENMRGRVMGVRMSVIVMLPVGNLIVGAGASVIGAPYTLGILGAIYTLSMLAVVMLTSPRNLD